MNKSRYLKQERVIAATSGNDIRERWLWGLRVLRDPEVMSSEKSLRHGAADQLLAIAASGGLRLSAREIQRRLQAARTYQTESQIRRAVADFESWRDLAEANFPSYPAAEGESPADHRDDGERLRDRERDLEDRFGEQGVLFLSSDVQPTLSPLKELQQYADEMAELTSRFVERDRKRREYVDQLIEAVGGDLSVTWLDAHHRVFGEQASA